MLKAIAVGSYLRASVRSTFAHRNQHELRILRTHGTAKGSDDYAHMS